MRNNSIDLLRLVASFFVIALHVGYYEDISELFGEIIRLIGRWAVPFFFLVTGTLIALKNNESSLLNAASKCFTIFLISTLLFLPYALLKNGNYFLDISLFNYLVIIRHVVCDE